MHDRDFVVIRGQRIRHTTAARDWVCGTCGTCLVTRWTDDGWRTVCYNDPSHDDQQFVHGSIWAYMEYDQEMERREADDIFRHLPAELQAAFTH